MRIRQNINPADEPAPNYHVFDGWSTAAVNLTPIVKRDIYNTSRDLLSAMLSKS